ncbi:MAG: hypothetical protein K6C40_07505 [Thermoguttaceae bacterium]|nr:hypothetical protein [Thermoguttaceae bacterium]
MYKNEVFRVCLNVAEVPGYGSAAMLVFFSTNLLQTGAKMNLLMLLYKILSPSGKEQAMQEFIIHWLEEHGIEYVKDRFGNILATKDTRPDKDGADDTCPCVCAHMDEVHANRETDYTVVWEEDEIFGYSPKTESRQGIGADDKNGIWVALKIMERIPYIKAAFFVSEEIGCIGSEYVDLGFFDNCRFVIECDRRESGDFIYEANDVPLCTYGFMEAMHASEYGYKPVQGASTDVVMLRKRGLKCCACNLSCGYYDPHTNNEYTRVGELQNCYELVVRACSTIKKRFAAPADTPPQAF